MNFRKWIGEVNETLLDLLIGCLVSGLFFWLVGLLVLPGKFHYSLGLMMGTMVAMGCAVNMASGIARILEMEEGAATRSGVMYAVIRTLVMLAVAFVGIKISRMCFIGVIAGLFTLKIAAHIHVYVNVYITKKIRRKGRLK